MGIFILLVLIPFFSIGLVLYFVTLYELATTGKLNELMMLVSTLLTVITSYFIPKSFVKILSAKTAKSLNQNNKILILSNYMSIVLLLLFGLAMLYRGIIVLNAIQILIGVGCVGTFGYATYLYFFSFDINDLTLHYLIDNKKYKELTFVGDDVQLTCYTDSNKYVEGNKYTVEYNRYTNIVRRINGMALGGDKNEKNNKEKH